MDLFSSPTLYVGHTGRVNWLWHVVKDKGATAMCGMRNVEEVRPWVYQPFRFGAGWCDACREALR